ncbi:MAG: hypothetical protein H6926_02585 [Chromatiales bacterium]|nr:hypothetical protein [Chromatiales bacterium]
MAPKTHPRERSDARLFGLLAAVTVAATLAGCAPTPYIPDTPDAATDMPVKTLEDGVRYARQTHNAYRAKILEEFEQRKNFNSGVVGFAATALGLAAYGAHTDTLIATGLIGGSAYQLGTFNTNNGRLGIYLEGMKATSCVQDLVAPLRIQGGQDRLQSQADNLVTLLDAVALKRGEVTRARDVVTIIEQGSQSGLLENARIALEDAKTTVNDANDVLERVESFRLRVEFAGPVMKARIDQIRDTVDDALSGTLSGLDSLPQIVSSLSSYANLFVPGLNLEATLAGAFPHQAQATDTTLTKTTAENGKVDGNPTAAGEPSKPQQITLAQAQADLAKAIGELLAGRQKIVTKISQIRGLMTPLAPDTINASLKSCGVDTSKLTTALHLTEASITLEPGKAVTRHVVFEGGTKPYRALLLTTPAPINPVLPEGSQILMIAATDGTKDGEVYKVRLSDDAGQSQILTVNIGTPPTTSPAPVKPTVTSPCEGQLKLWTDTLGGKGSAETCLIQRVFHDQYVKNPNLSLDGEFGHYTCQAMFDGWATVIGTGTPLNTPTDQTRRAIKTFVGLDAGADADKIKAAGLGCEGSFTKATKDIAKNASLAGGTTTTPAAVNTACTFPSAADGSEFECHTLTQAQLLHMRGIFNESRSTLVATLADFDAELRQAIQAFKEGKGLQPANGVLDQPTWDAFIADHPMPAPSQS